ncbi:hypothetical protein QBZ16_002555 [Prototheca wickerhamii]|uniref:Uncharacterized protein n=1 Tax=Prototheca wickerhamii TaxID=3111 RepID=A0AAD9IKH7_PROWI|nr:hypothetical protein QBZ16_002555 [Prototheca wickerhamii]
MGVPELMALGFDDLLACKMTAQDVGPLMLAMKEILEGSQALDQKQVWRLISKHILRPDLPFELHSLLFKTTYQGWDAARLGPPPSWVSDEDGVSRSNIARFMRQWKGNELWRRMRTGRVAEDWPLLHRISVEDPELFWPAMLAQLSIRFQQAPSRVLAPHRDPDTATWFPDARLNIAECALSGRDPDRPALVWADEASPEDVRTVTLGELSRRAWHVCAAIRAAGHAPGAAIAMDMLLTADAVAIYLGIVLAGCVVVSIADSFSAPEIASRLRIAKAAAIFTQDHVLRGERRLPLFARVAEAGAPPAVVLPARAGDAVAAKLRPGDVTWRAFLESAPAPAGAAALRAPRAHAAAPDAPSNVLFSSGTTGEPKAIAFTHATPLRAGADAFMHQDVRAGDVVCWPTSLGWMMGPWLLYAALLNDAAVALFHGAPTGRAFGRFVAAARVTTLGTVPSLVKAWRSSGCMAGLDWSALRTLSSTGESSAPEDSLWLSARAGYKPVIEYCGGTELGGAYLTGTVVQDQAPSTFSTPSIGTQIALLPRAGAPSPHGDPAPVAGEVAVAAPGIGQSQTLLNRDHAATYLHGMPRGPRDRYALRRHGDEIERLPGGLYRALGRADDTMNLGGIKTSSAELERAVTAHVPAARAAPPATSELAAAAGRAIAKHLNPLFKVHRVIVRPALPRNAANKVMRRVLRDELMASQAKL